jgi:ceramide glucosyltransferase
MNIFLEILLAIALVGTASSTVFLGMALVAASRHRRGAREQRRAMAAVSVDALLPVSVFKPLCGEEPRLEEALESFFRQDYPGFELVFGCRSSSDAALPVVERLRARYPQVAARVVIAGEPEWPNAKVWSLAKMIASSQAQYLLISDSDVLVEPDFLRNVVPPLLQKETGMVTCLYEGVAAAGLWSRLEGLGMSVEMASGVLIADMLEGMRFALGPAIAVRRDALERIGGMACAAQYHSDDFILGNMVAAAGYRVLLSHYRVGHLLRAASFRKSFSAQLRWMQSTRYSRPKGHLGTGLTFAVPFGVLGLASAGALGHVALGVGLVAASLLNRAVQSVAVGYGVVGDRRALRFCWLYPLRDLMGFCVWLASYLGGSSFRWRGELYRFTLGGRIVSVSRDAHARPS